MLGPDHVGAQLDVEGGDRAVHDLQGLVVGSPPADHRGVEHEGDAGDRDDVGGERPRGVPGGGTHDRLRYVVEPAREQREHEVGEQPPVALPDRGRGQGSGQREQGPQHRASARDQPPEGQLDGKRQQQAGQHLDPPRPLEGVARPQQGQVGERQRDVSVAEPSGPSAAQQQQQVAPEQAPAAHQQAHPDQRAPLQALLPRQARPIGDASDGQEHVDGVAVDGRKHRDRSSRGLGCVLQRSRSPGPERHTVRLCNR